MNEVLESIKNWNENRKVNKIYRLLDSVDKDSNIVEHIKTELPEPEDNDDDMQVAMNNHLMRMGKLFSVEGHSRFSAAYVTSALNRLLMFEPLGPLTGEESEWVYDIGNGIAAQNKRCSSVFLREDGTAYNVDGRVFIEPSGVAFTNKNSTVEVTFPYTPSKECVYVDEDHNPIEGAVT